MRNLIQTYQEKYSIFECGFHSFLGQNRTQFGIKFFIFALVYLLLDIEILLIFPYALSGYRNNIYGLSITILVLIVITLGFVFELGRGALHIDSRQSIKLPDTSKNHVVELIAKTTGNLNSNKVNISTANRTYTTLSNNQVSNYIIDLFYSSDDLLFTQHIYLYKQLYNYLVLTNQLYILQRGIIYTVYFILLLYLAVYIYKILSSLNNNRSFLFELCYIISRDIKLYYYIKDLYAKINAYLSRYGTKFKYNNLKAMASGDNLPYFVASTAIISIGVFIGHVEAELIYAQGNMTPSEHLSVLQWSRDFLDTFLKDNAKCANASVNIPLCEQYGADFIMREYQDRYYNTHDLYTSAEWSHGKELSVRLKNDIIRFHKAGIVNEHSYSIKGGSPILKQVKSAFPDAWKSYEYKWNNELSKYDKDLWLAVVNRNGWR